MKRLIGIGLTALLAATALLPQAKADLKEVLEKLGNGGSGGIDDVKNLVGDIIGGKVEYKDLVGDWEYVSPAVSFKSENLLKMAGGAAAATKIEKEIEPYYQKAGLNNLKICFAADSTFTMKLKSTPLKGTVTLDDAGEYHFNFKAFGKIKTGSMTAYMERSGKNVKMTFDVSKLISLVEKISVISGNSTIKGLSALLSSYDGLNAGFELQKTAETK